MACLYDGSPSPANSPSKNIAKVDLPDPYEPVMENARPDFPLIMDADIRRITSTIVASDTYRVNMSEVNVSRSTLADRKCSNSAQTICSIGFAFTLIFLDFNVMLESFPPRPCLYHRCFFAIDFCIPMLIF